MASESKFWHNIKHVLNNIPDSTWFRIEQLSTRGTPDVLGVVNGTFIALELKKSEEALKKGLKGTDSRTKLQDYNIKKITRSGGYASFCYPENWAEVYSVLLAISEGRWSNE